MNSKVKNLVNGIIKENPIFVQLLGMCPTLGVTSSAANALGMGLATTSVLLLANIFISLIRKLIPDKIRIPAFIVVIASFVTIIGMLMQAFLPDLFDSLGLFIPLIVVNCLILARAEAYAFKNGVIDSAFDGLGMGLGFTLALTILGSVRELFGAGALFGVQILNEGIYVPNLIMIQPPGAFLALALLLALYNQYNISKKKKKVAQEKKEKAEKKAKIEAALKKAEEEKQAKLAAKKAEKEAKEKAAKEAEENAEKEAKVNAEKTESIVTDNNKDKKEDKTEKPATEEDVKGAASESKAEQESKEKSEQKLEEKNDEITSPEKSENKGEV